MFCPQCGTESGPSLQYCRSCGANLKVIGKAVTLSEAIARSDRGPLPRIKEMVKSFKIEQVTDEISGALDQMNDEILRSSDESRAERARRKLEHRRGTASDKPWWDFREKKTPERRREEHRIKGTVSFFTGIGLTIFLYNLVGALVLKLPPDVLARIPFEVQPLVHVLWTVGLIPTLSGVGHFAASFFIKSAPERVLGPANAAEQDFVLKPRSTLAPGVTSQVVPPSVTDHTTELLTSDAVRRNQ